MSQDPSLFGYPIVYVPDELFEVAKILFGDPNASDSPRGILNVPQTPLRGRVREISRRVGVGVKAGPPELKRAVAERIRARNILRRITRPKKHCDQFPPNTSQNP